MTYRSKGEFEKRYPHISRWVKEHGWIEFGWDEFLPSFIKALDAGGMVWEGAQEYATLDEAFDALEAALAEVALEQDYGK